MNIKKFKKSLKVAKSCQAFLTTFSKICYNILVNKGCDLAQTPSGKGKNKMTSYYGTKISENNLFQFTNDYNNSLCKYQHLRNFSIKIKEVDNDLIVFTICLNDVDIVNHYAFFGNYASDIINTLESMIKAIFSTVQKLPTMLL